MKIKKSSVIFCLFISCFAVTFGDTAKKKTAYQSPISAERIEEITGMLPEKPGVFFYPCSNRTAWESLKIQRDFQKIISKAESLLKKEFPKWDDEAYLEFSRNGKRPRGQAMMKKRMDWLAPLVWAECLENKGRFVPAIEMVLHELVAQPTWTLAAHDRSLNCFKRTHYSVDLRAATNSHELAHTLYLLQDKLDPAVVKEVRDALEERIFAPMRQSIKTGKGNGWLRTTSNWNAVCLAGVAGAALAVIEDPVDRALFVAMSEHYSKYSLKGFTSDGYCTEGVGYYNYGFSNYIILRETILQATEGKLDLFADPKVRKIGAFGPNMQIIGDVYPAIADCRFGSKVYDRIVAYCDRALGLGLNADMTALAAKPGRIATGCMYAELYPATSQVTQSPLKEDADLRSYFKEIGVLVCRPGKKRNCRFGAALKGGHNAEHHNHNDVGTFSIQLGNKLIVADPGGPHMYNSKTFSSQRYEIHPSISSLGHPVPVVNGIYQQPGKKARAKVVRTDFGDEQDIFVIDILSAYPVDGLTKLMRRFSYDRRGAGKLMIVDEFAGKEPIEFETALTTHGSWKKISDNKLVFAAGKEQLNVEIKGPSCGWTINETLIEDSAPAYKRVGIKLNEPAAQGTVTMTFSPKG